MIKVASVIFLLISLAVLAVTIFPGLLFVLWVTDHPTSGTWIHQLINYIVWSVFISAEMYAVLRSFQTLFSIEPSKSGGKFFLKFSLGVVAILVFLYLVYPDFVTPVMFFGESVFYLLTSQTKLST